MANASEGADVRAARNDPLSAFVDAVASPFRAAQQAALDAAENATKKAEEVQQAAKDTNAQTQQSFEDSRDRAAQSIEDVKARAAQSIAEAQEGVGRLRNVPSDIGGKLVNPVLGPATAAALALAEAPDKVATGATNLAAGAGSVAGAVPTAGKAANALTLFPGMLKERLIDSPVNSVTRAAAAVSEFPNQVERDVQNIQRVGDNLSKIPGYAANRLEKTANVVKGGVDAVAAIPGAVTRTAEQVGAGAANLGKGAAGIADGVGRTAAAIGELPGNIAKAGAGIAEVFGRPFRAAQAAGEVVSTASSNLGKGLGGVAQGAMDVIAMPAKIADGVGQALSVPGQVVDSTTKKVTGVVDGVTSTFDAIGSFASGVADVAGKAADAAGNAAAAAQKAVPKQGGAPTGSPPAAPKAAKDQAAEDVAGDEKKRFTSELASASSQNNGSAPSSKA